MASLRPDTIDLFAPMLDALLELLGALTPAQWAQPTVCGDWDVHDIVMHLLGVDTANVSRHRDRHHIAGPDDLVDLGPWLHEFNESWVAAGRRLSGPMIVELLEVAGHAYAEHVRSIDLEPVTSNVSWASADPVPVWLDVAREYTERWVHQQQIREAVDRPGLDDEAFVAPVLMTFVHALPMALRDIEAGGVVDLRITGAGGGSWHVVGRDDGWHLHGGPTADADARLETDAGNAWRLFTRHPRAAAPAMSGDLRLAEVAARAVAIII